MTRIEWNTNVLAIELLEIEEPLLRELAEEVAGVARSIAPMRRHGGRLKASVHTNVGEDEFGLYGDVISLWYGRFLDPKARQLHRLYPFLPSSLYFVIAGQQFF